MVLKRIAALPQVPPMALVILAVLTVTLMVRIINQSPPTPRQPAAPITAATLSEAARLAEADGFGYDYSCAVYQTPRQVECVGQGQAVLFLVDSEGVPRLEPNQS